MPLPPPPLPEQRAGVFGSPPPPGMNVRLAQCPQCGYSLVGSPAEGRCPECGFRYDSSTMVLLGISRGVSTMHPFRVLLWVFVGIVGSLVPQLVIELNFGRGPGGDPIMPILAVVGSLAVAAFVYLIVTSKRERSGFEPFLFAAGGFGSCAEMSGSDEKPPSLNLWKQVDGLSLERKSKGWYRLRIGRGEPGRRFRRVLLDAGVKCDETTAPQVLAIIQGHIDRAHGDLEEPEYDET